MSSSATGSLTMSYIRYLEAEIIHIFRDVAAELRLVDDAEGHTIEQRHTSETLPHGVVDLRAVPITGTAGTSIVTRSVRMPWYRGESILEILQSVYVKGDRNLVDFSIPGAIRGPNRSKRSVASECQIARSILRAGDEVLLLSAQEYTWLHPILTPRGE